MQSDINESTHFGSMCSHNGCWNVAKCVRRRTMKLIFTSKRAANTHVLMKNKRCSNILQTLANEMCTAVYIFNEFPPINTCT